MLKECLSAILRQTFSDFEVIVGNDYTQETLSAEVLGIEDSRIRFVNYAQNLGEVENMNSLLGMGRGQYFTWLADDDLYIPDFLQALHAALVKFNFPPCAFTSFGYYGRTCWPDVMKDFSGQPYLFSGRQFLRMYLGGKLKVLGNYGVFDTESLRQIGGFESLSDAPIGLLGEYMLLVRTGLLKNIAYVDAPLVLYRAHKASWGRTNTEADPYKQAGKNLVRESVKVLSRPELRDDFRLNISPILKLSLNSFAAKSTLRDGSLDAKEMVAYLFSMKKQFNALKGSVLYWIALANLNQLWLQLVWLAAKYKFKSVAPSGLVKLARTVRSSFTM